MGFGIALIGTGNIAGKHASAIKKIKDAFLVGVLSSEYARAVEFSKKHECKAYKGLQELLNDAGVSIVDIVNKNNLHADFGLECVRSGKHVIIEKPIDINIVKARKLIIEARKRNVHVTLVSQYRFGGGYQKVKRMIDDGRFGRLIMGVVVIGKSRGEKDYLGWRGKKKEAGGGVMIMNAVHYINIMKWLFGEVKEVNGKISTITHDIEVEDTGGAVLKFKNSAIGVIAATTSLPFNVPDRLEVYGSKMAVVIENGRVTRVYKKNMFYSLISSMVCRLNFNRKGNIKDQINNFIMFLQGKENLMVDASEGVMDLEIIEKIYKES